MTTSTLHTSVLSGVMALTLLSIPLAQGSARAEEAGGEPTAEGYPRTVTVSVADKDTNQPLFGAALTVRVAGEERELTTDESGSCSVELIAPPKHRLVFTAMHEGYVRDWLSVKPDEVLRSDLQHIIRLEKGVSIGGVIVDESGKPVEDVRVTFWLRTGRRIQVETATDVDGRWALSIPKEEIKPAWQLQHPDFPLSTTFSWIGITDELRAGEYRCVIERGFRVEGVVVDEAGVAVEGAFVLRGFIDFDDYPSLRERMASGEVRNVVVTDKGGRFSIPVGPDTEAMVVCAEHYAPAMFEVVRDGIEHRVVLPKGRTWTGRVQAVSGEGAQGASVRCYDWQYRRNGTLMMRPYKATTDANGDFSMACLPEAGLLTMSVKKGGFFSVSLEPLVPNALPESFTLHPSAPLQGRVYDAKTKAPVETFTVDFGFSEAAHPVATYHCHDPFLRSSKDGTFSINTGLSLDEQPGAVWVRVCAPAYYPTFIDPVWALDFAAKPVELALEPGAPILGKVLTPDGDAAEGATLALVHEDELAMIQNYRVDMSCVGAPYNTATSGDDGAFALAPSKKPALILVLHESGWLIRATAEHKPGDDLRLSAWCSLEGQVPLEGRPEEEKVYVNAVLPIQKEWGEKEPIQFSLGTTVDAEGHFRIDYVPALPLKVGENRRWLMSHATDVIAKPGECVEVEVGDANGGAISGRIIVDELVNPEGAFREPWHASRRFLIAARPKGAEAADEYANYIPLLQEDGAFTLDRLPLGEYELTATAHEQPPENACGRGTPRARVTRSFVIEADHSETLDLGSLQLERIIGPGAGDAAPEIEGKSLDAGTPWKLSGEYADGKPILLVFWTTWCAPCKEEIPMLKGVWEDYGKGERLQVIGLNLDSDEEKAARFAASEGLDWPQYNVGEWGENNPATNAYGVAYIPSNWLIGPDGGILAGKIPPDELRETLEEHMP